MPTSSFRRPRPVAARFRTIEQPLKERIAELRSPLRLGMAVLSLAEDRFRTDYVSADEIVDALENVGVRLKRQRLVNAFSRAGGKVTSRRFNKVTKYRVMLPGKRDVAPLLAIGNIKIAYIEGDQPRTDRLQVKDILGRLSGTVRISDPYYGVRTLDTLAMIPKACPTQFLTGRTTEKPTKLAGPLADFKREMAHVKMRLAANPDGMHDRYVISDGGLLLIGHGLKDIGNKESFIISLDRSIAADLISQLVDVFDRRWILASPL